MKREEIERELQKVLDDANELRHQSELELKTADFLQRQADALIERFEDPNTPFDEREKVYIQMEALHKKMTLELKMWEANLPKIEKLDERLNQLQAEVPED